MVNPNDQFNEETGLVGCFSDIIAVVALPIVLTFFWFGYDISISTMIGLLAASILMAIIGFFRRYFLSICVLLYAAFVRFSYLI